MMIRPMHLTLVLVALCSLQVTTAHAQEEEVLCCFAGACIPWTDPPEECPGEIVVPGVMGGCCFPGTCVSPVSPEACDISGGVYLGDGSDCGDPADPPEQCPPPPTDFPCCLDGGCGVIDANECVALGGVPILVPDTDCSDVNCVEPAEVGGCCGTADGCTNGVSAEECDDLGGEFLGLGVACQPSNCDAISDLHCCCADGACFESDPAECAELGGVGISEVGTSCTCHIPGGAPCEAPILIHQAPITGDNEGLEETEPIDQPEEIIAGDNEPPEETEPFTGIIDPRMESSNGVNVDLGITYADVVFSQPVFGDALGGPVTLDNFTISQTGPGVAPSIVSIQQTDSRTYRVTWDRPVSTREWTTLKTLVYSAFGTPVLDLGDLGPDNEPDRIDIGFLPGDVNQDGVVSPLDLLRFRQGVSGVWQPEVGTLESYLDIDRNGDIGPVDLLRLRQLFTGTGDATQPWAGASMAADRP